MKLVIRIVAVSVGLLILAMLGLIFLTEQPDAPTPDFPEPQSRDEAWRQDIAYLRDEFLDVDRSFTPETSKEFLEILYDLDERVPSLSDNQIVIEITRAVARSKNGHTRTYLMRNGNYLRRWPVRFYWFSNGLYVVRATPEFSQTLGTRVVAIDGTFPEDLMSSIRDLVPGSDWWVIYKSSYFLNSPEFLNGLGVVSNVESVPITFESPDGTRFTSDLQPLPLDQREGPYEAWRDLSPFSTGNADGREWLHVLSGREVTLYLRSPDAACSYEYLPDVSLLYIQINRNESDETCSQSDFAREMARLAETTSPKVLVFDVRFDTGGNYQETADIAKGLPTWFGSAERIYIVTGPATFSAGIATAARLKYFSGERAVVVGEPAGDALKEWSEGPTFTLPNSKLQIKAATAFHDFAEARFELGKTFFGDLFYSVPAGDIDVDLPVTVSFEDYLSVRDPVLEAISSQ